MDPHLLSLLPDAAKLGILRHLGSGAAGSTQHPQLRQQQGASPPPPSQEGQQYGLQRLASAAGTNQRTVPAVLVGRRLEGGVAVIDGFLSAGETQVGRSAWLGARMQGGHKWRWQVGGGPGAAGVTVSKAEVRSRQSYLPACDLQPSCPLACPHHPGPGCRQRGQRRSRCCSSERGRLPAW